MPRFVTSPEVLQLIGTCRVIDPPVNRKQWTASRLVVSEDGTVRPLLELLAEHKWPTDDLTLYMVFWADKNWTNECLENVARTLKRGTVRLTRTNQYGAPAGTLEYNRAYRARPQNKEKANKYHKERYARMRAAYIAQRDAVALTTSTPPAPPTPDADFMAARLERILNPPKPEPSILAQPVDWDLVFETRKRLAEERDLNPDNLQDIDIIRFLADPTYEIRERPNLHTYEADQLKKKETGGK